jgi:septal ring factor EnvC (AmiA/AmiB activator)
MSDTPFDHLRIEQLKEEASEEWDFLCPHDNEWHECGAAPCQRTAKMKQRIAELEDAARQVTPVAPESLVEQSKLIARVAALEAEREALGATCPTCLAMAAHVGCPTAAEAWDVIMRTNMQNHDTIQEQFNKVKEQARDLAAARERIEHLEEKREQLKAIIIHSNQRALRIAENLESSTTRIAALEAERDRLRCALGLTVDAMRSYEMDVDEPPPFSHRTIMEAAHAALAGEEKP